MPARGDGLIATAKGPLALPDMKTIVNQTLRMR